MRIWEGKRTACGTYVLLEESEQVYVEGTGREEIRWWRKDQVPDPAAWRIKRNEFSCDKNHPGCMFLAYAIMYRCFQSKGAADLWAKAAAWKFLYMRVGGDFTISERHIRRWIEAEYEKRKSLGLQEYADY